MAAIDDIWLAALTKDEDDAGSRNRFNLTVNIDGADVFGHDFILGWNLPGQGRTGLRDGQAGLEEADAAGALRFRQADQLLRAPWPSRRRRVGTEARHGHRPCAARFHARPRSSRWRWKRTIDRWLSADGDEGRLTMPVRRVGAGTSNTVIRRVLLLIYTDRGDDVDTESDIKLQICRQRSADAGPEDHPRLQRGSRLLALPRSRAALHPRGHSLQGLHPPQHPGNRRLAADDGLRLRARHGRRATRARS